MRRLQTRIAEEQNVENQNSSDNEIIIDILNRIKQSSEDAKDAYYILLDNLNALSKSYPGIYNEFKLIVKLPDQKQINNIAQMEIDIEKAVNYLNDPEFLNGLLKK